ARDKVHEPATMPALRENTEASDIAKRSSTHCNQAQGELSKELGEWKAEEDLIDWFSELPPLLPPPLEPSVYTVFPSCPEKDCVPKRIPESPEALKFLPSHQLLPPSPLSSVSPSTHPQPSICAVGSPLVCQSPLALRLEDPSSPPPASESWTPPQPVDSAAPPWPLAPSSLPWPGSPLAPLGSLIPPAPSWSGVNHPVPRDSTPLASPRPSVSLAPSGSAIPPAPPWSSVAPDPPAPPPSVGPLESSVLPPPWLLPLSAPPWAIIMAVAWVPSGSSCSKSLL
ncbi:hypothetical protein M9458_002896, partial [Cirrhinus mrigala]